MLGAARYLAGCLEPESATADGGFETLLTFEHEAHGQDVIAVGTTDGKRKRVLVQFKFSLNPDRYPITPAELEEIATKLQQGAAAVNQRHENLPTDLILRTNRPLSDTAVSKPLPGGLNFQKFDPLEARQALEGYATAFGIFPGSEIESGVHKVVGLLFERAASPGSRLVSAGEFNSALVGIRDPRRLFIPELIPFLTSKLEEQRTLVLGTEENEFLTRRDAWNEILQVIDDSLIVILGGGGCGKSTLLLDLLTNAVSGGPGEQQLAALITDQSKSSLPALVAGWRTTAYPVPITDPADVAINRLIIANTTIERPVMILGLDGIDEMPYDERWRAAACDLIQYFWRLHQTEEVPPARLCVTCRTPHDLEPFIGTKTGRGVPGRPPRYITLTHFSDEELILLCQKTPALDPHVAMVLEGSLRVASISKGSIGSNPVEIVAGIPRGSGSASAEQILNAIRHPVVWRCFAAMSHANQQAMLSGPPTSFDPLADGLIDWFLKRTKSRCDLDSVGVRSVLVSVAKHTASDGPYSPGDWNDPGRMVSGWADVQVDKLRREALSSGLLDEIPPVSGAETGKWRWRHQWLLARLCAL